MASLSSFFRRLAKTLLQISVGVNDYMYMPAVLCGFVILINFFQHWSYLLHPFSNVNLKFLSFFVTIFNFFNPPVNIIQEGASVGIGLFIFVCYQGIVVYIIFLSVVKEENVNNYIIKGNLTRNLTYIIYIFFTLWNYIFFIPFLHLFISLSFCAKTSPIKANQTNCQINFGYSVIFIIASVETILFSLIINNFFVEVHFLEDNFLKRRFRNVNLLEILLTIVIICFWIFGPSKYSLIIQLCSLALAIIKTFELLRFMTFKEINLSKFYGFLLGIFIVIAVCCIIRDISSIKVADHNFLFTFLMLGPLIGACICRSVGWYVSELQFISCEKPGMFGCNIDLFLETILKSAKSTNDEVQKNKLLAALIEHKEFCTNPKCLFKKEKYTHIFVDADNQLIYEEFVWIINLLFHTFFSSNYIKSIKVEEDNLYLKYFSFLSIDYGNPIYAYSMLLRNLNKIDSRNTETSWIFNLKSQVISERVKDLVIIASNLSSSVIKRGAVLSMNELSMNSYNLYKSYIDFDNYKLDSLELIQEIIDKKFKFWEKILDGYPNLDEFLKSTLDLSRKIENLKIFNKARSEHLLSKSDTNNIVLTKIQSIIKCLVLNDIAGSFELEKKITEAVKENKEMSMTNGDILHLNSVCVYVSLLDEGKLVGYVSPASSKFFGFSSVADFQNAGNIHMLMTKRFGDLHHDFLKKVLNYGDITFFGFPRDVVCKDKENYIFNAQAFVQFFFGIKNEFTISAVFLKTITPQLMFFTDEFGNIDGVSRSKCEDFHFEKGDLDFVYRNYNILHFIPALFDDEKKIIDIGEDKIGRKLIYTDRILSLYIPSNIRAFYRCVRSNMDTNSLPSIAKKTTKIQGANTLGILQSLDGDSKNDTALDEKRAAVKKVLKEALNDGLIDQFVCSVSLLQFTFQKTNKDRLSFFQISIKDVTRATASMDLSNGFSTSSKMSRSTIKSKGKEDSKNQVNSDSEDKYESSEEQRIKKNMKKKIYGVEEKDSSFTLEEDAIHLSGLSKSKELDLPVINENKEDEAQTKKNPPEIYETLNIMEDRSIPPSERMGKTPNGKDQQKHEESKINPKLKSKEKIKVKESGEKNSISDENDRMHATSINSKASNFSVTGVNYLKDISQSNSIPRFIKQLAFIYILLISIFVLINILYVFLMYGQLDSYKDDLRKGITPVVISSGYTSALTAVFPMYIEKKSEKNNAQINVNSILLLNFSISSLESSYNDFSNQNDQLNKYIRSSNYSIYYLNQTQAVNSNFLEFLKLSIDKMKDLQILFSFDDFMFLSGNFVSGINNMKAVIQAYQNQLDSNSSSITAFFLLLTSFGIIIGVILPIVSLPLVFKYLNYIEKILLLVSRLNEKEARHEKEKMEDFSFILASIYEEYLLKNFSTDYLKPSKSKKKSLQKKNLNQQNNIYLSSKIRNQKLNRSKFYLVKIGILVVLSLYFIIFFSLTSNFKAALSNSSHFLQTYEEMENAIDNINLSQYMAFVNHKYSLNLDQNDLLLMAQDAQNQLQIKFQEQQSMFSELPSYQQLIVSNYLQNSLCQQFKIKQCEVLKEDIFAKGLQGLISKFLILYSDFQAVLQRGNYDVFDMKFSEENLMEIQNWKLVCFQFFSQLRSQFLDFSQILVTNLYSSLLLAYIIGGTIISVLLVFFLYKVIQNMNRTLFLSRNILLLIPYKKLLEDTTIHLMKKLKE